MFGATALIKLLLHIMIYIFIYLLPYISFFFSLSLWFLNSWQMSLIQPSYVKLRGLSPRTKYTDRATATWRCS
jgi:hypothetical protein